MEPMCFRGMWMFPVFPIIMMAICLLIIYLIFVRGRIAPPCCGSDPYHLLAKGYESALDILKKRYAKGEISKEKFEKIKKDLL